MAGDEGPQGVEGGLRGVVVGGEPEAVEEAGPGGVVEVGVRADQERAVRGTLEEVEGRGHLGRVVGRADGEAARVVAGGAAGPVRSWPWEAIQPASAGAATVL